MLHHCLFTNKEILNKGVLFKNYSLQELCSVVIYACIHECMSPFLSDKWLVISNILNNVPLVHCVSDFTFAILSKSKFLNKGFVNYDIHVFKEFKMLGGREMANCSQECILENDCTGFVLCEVDSSQVCRLTNDSPNPKPSLDISAPCRHFIKVSCYSSNTSL